MKIIALALVSALALGGCSATTGTLTPAAQATVAQYLASYCPVEAAIRAQAQTATRRSGLPIACCKAFARLTRRRQTPLLLSSIS